MKKKLPIAQQRMPQQQVFQFQDQALASLDVKAAKKVLEVFDQAWATRLWTQVPMIPWKPEPGWKQNKDKAYRRELQNTFQLNALSVDMGIEREELAKVPSFRAFVTRAKEAVRLFDLRVGPPWWIRDREFLESAYIASQEQEHPEPELADHLWSYWGDDAMTTPYWVAQNFFDHEHASSADIMGQVVSAKSYSKWDNELYRQTLLLNWQVTMQPLLAYAPDSELGHPWEDTFPHQFELKRLIRLLNLTPRTRPERNLVHAGTTGASPQISPPTVARNKDHKVARRRLARAGT
jgi:hypothetical protein